MTTYTCEKCARIFKQKSGYTDHMKKKIDCTTVSAIAPILEEMKEMKREIQEMKRESGSVEPVEPVEPVEIDFSKKTKDELKAFCKENNIIPIDANEFQNQLQSKNENTLYSFYKEE